MQFRVSLRSNSHPEVNSGFRCAQTADLLVPTVLCPDVNRWLLVQKQV